MIKPAANCRSNGQIKPEQHQMDERYKLDGPAVINYDSNGQIESEEYLVDGKLLKGEALENYLIDLQIKRDIEESLLT